MPSFILSRLLRTASSEIYYVHRRRSRRMDGTNPAVAQLHLHFHGKLYFGALLLRGRLSDTQLEALQSEIYEIVDDVTGRNDFIFTVYDVKERADFSDSVSEEDRRWEPPVRRDLEEIAERFNQVLGKHQVARGLLNEHALVEFFSAQGYEARKADSLSDHDGIDVIATKSGEVVYAQAKLGEASARALKKLASAVAARSSSDGVRKVGVLAGDRFPPGIEFVRMELEAKHGIALACIDKATVLRSAKVYRHALE